MTRAAAGGAAPASAWDPAGRRLEWIRDEARFLALKREWDALAEPYRTPFLRHAWICSWWRAFGRGARLSIAALWEDGELVGLFPLIVRKHDLAGFAGPTAPDFRPFGRDDAAVRKLVDAALALGPSRVILNAVPAADIAARAIEDAARARRFLVERGRMQVSPYIETRGDFQAYLASLHRDVRRKPAARRRKLEAEHDVAWSIWGPPQDVERDLEEALTLEAAGWKGAEGGAILASPQLAQFYRELAHAFHAEGRFALAKLEVDGRLAAVVICLVDFDRIWLLKMAYDEALRDYSPGTLIAFAILERCFELGLEACELLGDMAEWKRRHHPLTREYDAFRLYRRRPIPLARLAYRRYLHPPLRRAYWCMRSRRHRRALNQRAATGVGTPETRMKSGFRLTRRRGRDLNPRSA